MGMIEWTDGVDTIGTSLRREAIPLPVPFNEAIKRLTRLFPFDPTKHADPSRTTVEFSGRYNGEVFTLYDWRKGEALNLGGSSKLDVPGVMADLYKAIDLHPVPEPSRRFRIRIQTVEEIDGKEDLVRSDDIDYPPTEKIDTEEDADDFHTRMLAAIAQVSRGDR